MIAPEKQETAGAGRFVLWLGDHASAQLDELPNSSLRGVALSLASVGRNRKSLTKAREREVPITLDPEIWRNQLPFSHPKRGGSFSSLAVAIAEKTPWDPHRPMTDTEFNWIARASIDTQIAADPDALLLAGHVYPGALGPARRNDLEIASRSLEIIHNEMRRARVDGRSPRKVTAQINVDLRGLEPLQLDSLIAAYAELDIDGYWINFRQFNGSKNQFHLVQRLALNLASGTERPVTVAGLGRLWPGALATGIDSVCFGFQRSTFPFPPPDLREQMKEGEGIGVHTYHEAILGAVRIGPKGTLTRQALFKLHPCHCGHHDPKTPPANKAEQIRHNAACMARDLAWATAPNLTQVEVERRVESANEVRERVGMKGSRVDLGWSLVYVPEDGRDAIGSSDE